MDKNETKESIRLILNGFEEIDLAYVHGSFLERDDFHDIDIAIHLCKEQPPAFPIQLMELQVVSQNSLEKDQDD